MITQFQKEKLLLAIDRAEQPGACIYVDYGRPCCVIGQLAFLERITLAAMMKWGAIYAVLRSPFVGAEPLFSYPEELLAYLQKTWDQNARGEQETRREMRNAVLAEEVKE